MPDWLEILLQSYLVIGAVVAIAVGILLWYALSRQPKTFKAFDSAGGEVHVTRKAVRELVRRCCEELGDVGSASTKIDIKNGLVHVTVHLRVRKSTNLKNVSGYLREQIGAVLSENLGVEEMGDIDIIVIGILEDPTSDED